MSTKPTESTHEHVIGRVLLIGALVVLLLSLASFGLSRLMPDLLPDRLVPDSLLATVTPGFVALLVYELFMLITGTRGSFIRFIHYEFEIISLIVLRDLFKKLDELAGGVSAHLLTELTVVAIGSIVLYFFVEVLERVRHNLTFAAYEEAQVSRHKIVRRTIGSMRVLLAGWFIAVVAWQTVGWLLGWAGFNFDTGFLSLIFGGLIVYNILTLFLVLLVSGSYETLFEHSALALASSVVLVALQQDPIVSVPLTVAALLFVIATLLLHGFARGSSIKTLMTVAASPERPDRKS